MYYHINCKEFCFFSETLCAKGFYNINSILTKRRSFPDRVEAFKNIFYPKNLRIFPSPNSILKFPHLTHRVKTGHVFLTILQYVFSLMEIENQSIIESFIFMVTEIKEAVHNLSSVSVVNSSHHNAQSLYRGKCLCVNPTVVNSTHHNAQSLYKGKCFCVGPTVVKSVWSSQCTESVQR